LKEIAGGIAGELFAERGSAEAGVRFRDRSNKPKRREVEILNRL
jgi:hypothetical protein